VILFLELVGGVEGGHRNIDDLQVADGAVNATWTDHNSGEGFQGDDFAIGFEVSFPFEDDVHLGHAFVVVGTTVGVDVGEVDGCGSVGYFSERASCFTARTWDGGEGVELCDVEAFHGRWKRRGSWSGARSRGWKMKLVE
jgi:hypothetical protein